MNVVQSHGMEALTNPPVALSLQYFLTKDNI